MLVTVPLRVAKAGYYGGNPEFVRQAPITDVFDILAYEEFLSEYEYTEYELNSPSS